jgi:hypothetical protein
MSISKLGPDSAFVMLEKIFKDIPKNPTDIRAGRIFLREVGTKLLTEERKWTKFVVRFRGRPQYDFSKNIKNLHTIVLKAFAELGKGKLSPQDKEQLVKYVLAYERLLYSYADKHFLKHQKRNAKIGRDAFIRENSSALSIIGDIRKQTKAEDEPTKILAQFEKGWIPEDVGEEAPKEEFLTFLLSITEKQNHDQLLTHSKSFVKRKTEFLSWEDKIPSHLKDEFKKIKEEVSSEFRAPQALPQSAGPEELTEAFQKAVKERLDNIHAFEASLVDWAKGSKEELVTYYRKLQEPTNANEAKRHLAIAFFNHIPKWLNSDTLTASVTSFLKEWKEKIEGYENASLSDELEGVKKKHKKYFDYNPHALDGVAGLLKGLENPGVGLGSGAEPLESPEVLKSADAKAVVYDVKRAREKVRNKIRALEAECAGYEAASKVSADSLLQNLEQIGLREKEAGGVVSFIGRFRRSSLPKKILDKKFTESPERQRELRVAIARDIFETIRNEEDEKVSEDLRLLASQIVPPPAKKTGISYRQVAMVLGDHFIGKSSFMGREVAGDTSSYIYVQLLLDSMQGRETSPRFRAVTQKLHNVISLASYIEPASGTTQKLSNDIRDRTSEKGSSVLIFGGYVGHAMLYEIKNEGEGKYSFYIYNKGEGSQFQRNYLTSGAQKVAPCLALTEISIENILNPVFLGEMLAISSMSKVNTPPPSDIIVQSLLPMLGGRPVPLDESVLNAVSPQRSGTCTMASLDAMLAYSLQQDEYRRCKFENRMHLLNVYKQEFGQIVSGITDMPRYEEAKFVSMVMKRSIEHFSARIQKLSAHIPEPLLEEARLVVLEYEDLLRQCSKNMEKFKAEQVRSRQLTIPQSPPVKTETSIAAIPAVRLAASGAGFFSKPASKILMYAKRHQEIASEDFSSNFLEVVQDVTRLRNQEFMWCCREVLKVIPSWDSWEKVSYKDPVQAVQLLKDLADRIASSGMCSDCPSETALMFWYVNQGLFQAYRKCDNVPAMPFEAFFPPTFRDQLKFIETSDPFFSSIVRDIKTRLKPGEDPLSWASMEYNNDIDLGPLHTAIYNWLQDPRQRQLVDAMVADAATEHQQAEGEARAANERNLARLKEIDSLLASQLPDERRMQLALEQKSLEAAIQSNEKIFCDKGCYPFAFKMFRTREQQLGWLATRIFSKQSLASCYESKLKMYLRGTRNSEILPEIFRICFEGAVSCRNYINKKDSTDNLMIDWDIVVPSHDTKNDPDLKISCYRQWINRFELRQRSSSSDRHLQSTGDDPELKKIAADIPTISSQCQYGEGSAPRLAAEKYAKESDIPFDLASDLCSILAEPAGQIDGIFMFFRDHREKLSQTSWIAVFHRILFDQDLLLRQLGDEGSGDQCVEMMRNFFAENIRFALDSNDVMQAADLIWIARSVERYISKVSAERISRGMRSLSSEPFITPEYVQRVIAGTERLGDKIDQGPIFEALLAACDGWVDVDPRSDAFQTLCCVELLQQQYWRVPQRKICVPRLEESLATANTLKLRMEDLSHQSDFNVIFGNIWARKEMLSLLPEWSRRGTIGRRIADGVLSIEQGGRQIGTVYTGMLSVRKSDATESYTDAVPKSIADLLANNGFLSDAGEEKRQSLIGLRDNETWYVFYPKTKAHFRVTGNEIYVGVPIGEQANWVKGIVGEQKKTAILNQALQKYVCLQEGERISLFDPETYKAVYSGTSRRMEHSDTHRILTTAPDFFKAFEDPSTTICLSDPDENKVEIQFTRTGITLEGDKGQYIWKEHKEWRLSLDQFVSYPQDIGSLVFENAEGEKLVVLPFADPAQAPEGIGIPYEYKQETIHGYHVYGYTEDGIVPKTIEGRYYLARIFLEQGEIDKAEALLYAHEALVTTRPLSEEAQDILKKISFVNASGSIDPRSTQIRVRAFLLLEKNRKQFPGACKAFSGEELKNKKSLMGLYITRRHGMKELAEEDVKLLGNDLISSQMQRFSFTPLRSPDHLFSPPQIPAPSATDSLEYSRAIDSNKLPFDPLTASLLTVQKYSGCIVHQLETSGRKIDKIGPKEIPVFSGLMYLAFCRPEPEIRQFAEWIISEYFDLQAVTGGLIQSQARLTSPDQSLAWTGSLRDAKQEKGTKDASREIKAPSASLREFTQSMREKADSELMALKKRYFVQKPESKRHLPLPMLEDFFEGSDPVVARKITEVRQDIEKAQASSRQDPEFDVASGVEIGGSVAGLLGTLEGYSVESSESLHQMEGEIVSSILSEIEDSSVRYAELAGKQQTRPTFQELCILYARKNSEQCIRKRFPWLSDEFIIDFRQKIENYLYCKRNLNQIDSAISLIKSLEKTPEGSPAWSQTISKIARALDAKEAFPPNDPYAPILLYMETAFKFRLREDQVAAINDAIIAMTSSPPRPVAMQMIMGAGKTSVILPLLMCLIAEEGKLSMVSIPEDQVVTVLDQFSDILGSKSVSQYVNFMDYDRKNIRGRNGFDFIMEFIRRLESIKKEGGCYIITPRIQYSIVLSYYETIKELDEANRRKAGLEIVCLLTSKVCAIGEILRIMRNSAAEEIDEFHAALDPRLTFRYPVGQPSVFDRGCGDILTEILFDLAEEFPPDISVDFIDGFRRRHCEGAAPQKGRALVEDDFNRIQKQLAAIAKRRLFEKMPVLKRLPEGSLESFLMQSKPSDFEGTREEFLQLSYGEFHRLGVDYSLIDVCASAITDILPTSLFKKIGVQYGKSRVSTQYTARPYSASDTPKTSIYAKPYMTAVYTVQQVMYYGIPREAAPLMIQKMRDSALEEMSAGVARDETKAFRMLLSCFNQREVESLLLPGKISEELLRDFHARINKNKGFLRLFLGDYAWPQILTYSESIFGTPYTFAGMVPACSGFSGTPPIKELLPKGMELRSVPGTDGKTILAIQQKMATGEARVVQFKEEDALDDVIRQFQTDPYLTTFIDAGGWFGDTPVPDFAKKLLGSSRPDIVGIVYFNEKKEKMMLVRAPEGGTREIQFSEKPDGKFFTVIAEQYATGTDIPQEPIAKALVSIGKEMDKTKLLQSSGRMRDLWRGQAVDFGLRPIEREWIANFVWRILERKCPAGGWNRESIKALQCPDSIKEALLGAIQSSDRQKEAFFALFKVDAETIWAYVVANEAYADQEKVTIASNYRCRDLFEDAFLKSAIKTSDTEDRLDVFRVLQSVFVETTSKWECFPERFGGEDAEQKIKRYMGYYQQLKGLEKHKNTMARQMTESIDAACPEGLEKTLRTIVQAGDGSRKLFDHEVEAEVLEESEALEETESLHEKQKEVRELEQALGEREHKPIFIQKEGVLAFDPDQYKKSEELSSLAHAEMNMSCNLFPNQQLKDFENLPGYYIAELQPKQGPSIYFCLSLRDKLDLQNLLKAGVRLPSGYDLCLRDLSGTPFYGPRKDTSLADTIAKIGAGSKYFSRQDIDNLSKIVGNDQERLAFVRTLYEKRIQGKSSVQKYYCGSQLYAFFSKKLRV